MTTQTSHHFFQGYDLGIGNHFSTLLTKFPNDLGPFCEMSISLASAGPTSAARLIDALSAVSVFAESLDTVPSDQIVSVGSSGDRWQLVCPRQLCAGDRDIFLPVGTTAVSDGRFYYWQPRRPLDGWRCLIAELVTLDRQISQGSARVSAETLANAVHVTALADEVLRANPEAAAAALEPKLTAALFSLVDKFVHLPHPPLDLLANCLKCLCSLAAATDAAPRVWARLQDSGLFPHFARSSNLQPGSPSDLNPGLVGAVLAQQECIAGEYPFTTAFLDLTLACVR